MGWLILLPVVIVAWLAIKVINYSVKGGIRRLVGVVTCPILGGLSLWGGSWLAFEGYLETRPDGIYQVTYPIPGWIGIVMGVAVILIGTLWSIFGRSKLPEVEDIVEDWF